MQQGIDVAGQADAPAAIAHGGVQGAPTPTEILQGFRAARSELRNQLERLEEAREDIVRDIQRDVGGDANIAALEQRLHTVDERILVLEQQIAQADMQVAQAAAVPGAVVPEPPPPPYVPRPDWDEVAMMGFFVTGVLLLPVMIAWTRRIWRRSAKIVTAIPDSLHERFSRLEQAVDSIAIEVERVGEGQRFMTRVLAEHGVPKDQIPASLTDELNLPSSTSSRGRG